MGQTTVISPNEEMTDIRQRFKVEWEDKEKLESEGLTFTTKQVAYFDEIHIYQVCACDKKQTLAFARDANGLYDKDGEIEEMQKKVSRIFIHSIV